MNKVRTFSALVVASFLPLAFMSSAQAAGDPIIFWHGDDWGKITGDRNSAIPRDNECDGNPVYIALYGDDVLNGEVKHVQDTNGCEAGGGTFTVPNWTIKARLCEGSYSGATCTSFSELSEW